MKQDNRNGGFSLIELLVVIMILAILMAIGLGVGMRILSQGSVAETRANMKIIMTAVEVYYDASNNKYPIAETTSGSHNLFDQLSAVEASRKIISGLPDNVFEKNSSGQAVCFVDAWDREIRYQDRHGLAGRPRVYSCGPDGEFGDYEQTGVGEDLKSEYAKDDISSDDK